MSLALAGTPAKTGLSAPGTTCTVNLPAGIQSQDLVFVGNLVDSTSRSFSQAGWTDRSGPISNSEGFTLGIDWKVGTGSEGATQVFGYNAGSNQACAIAVRITGADNTDPFDSNNNIWNFESSEDPFTLASGLITSISAGSWVMLLFGSKNAQRTVSSWAAGLDQIRESEVSGTTGDHSLHLAAESAPGSGNSAFSNDMNSTRDYGYMLSEIKAGAAAGQPTMRRFLNPLGRENIYFRPIEIGRSGAVVMQYVRMHSGLYTLGVAFIARKVDVMPRGKSIIVVPALPLDLRKTA